MKKKNRSQATFDDYQSKIDCHLTDWLDRPLVAITPEMCQQAAHQDRREQRHLHGQRHHAGAARDLATGAAAASELPEPPTSNVDFYPETGRTNVITDWPAWWEGIQQIANPVRRDFYIWLAFSGCRAGETMRWRSRTSISKTASRNIRSPRPRRSKCR